MGDIGRKIRQLREAKGMTQEELAHKVGYKSRVSINKIELQRDIPIKRLLPIAKALDVSPADIVGWEPDPIDAEFIQAIEKIREQEKVGNLSLDESKLVMEYRNADELTQQMIKKLLGI